MHAASVSPDDFICSTIKHKYNDAVTKEDTWWDAKVIFSFYTRNCWWHLGFSKRQWWQLFPGTIINDYLNGWLRLFQLILDPLNFDSCFLWLILGDIGLLMPFEPLLQEKGMISVNPVSLDVFWWVLVDGERMPSLGQVLKYKHKHR